MVGKDQSSRFGGQRPILVKNVTFVNLLPKPRKYDDINGHLTGKQNGKNAEIKIGTWNIRTLYKPGGLKNINSVIAMYKLHIVALQEIRWPGNGNMQIENVTVFYSSTNFNRYEKGVGFVVNNTILPCIKKIEAVNERICYIHAVRRKFDTILINCYAPTEEKDEEEKSTFYEEVERIYDSLPRHCIKVIVGDFNAQVGKELMFRSTIRKENLLDTSNDNGNKLINFAISRELVISCTYFPRKNIHKHE